MFQQDSDILTKKLASIKNWVRACGAADLNPAKKNSVNNSG